MRLLKGWKLTLMASMALAGSSGQGLAQKPGSWDTNKTKSSGRSTVLPASYEDAVAPGYLPGGVAPLEYNPLEYNQPFPQDGSVAAAAPMEGVPMEGVPMMGGEPCYVDPAMMGPGMMGPGMMGPGMMGPGMMGPGGPMPPCPECGGPCPGCGGSHLDRWGRNPFALFGGFRGALAGIPALLVPYGEGGIASQRWYDASLEAIGLTRTTSGNNFNVSSLGANSGNYVLSTDSVDPSSMRWGLAAQVNVQVGPGSNLEFGYFGLDRSNGYAEARSDTANLYSFVSNFGTLPAGGFDDSDRSLLHTLSYSSQLQSTEMNLRRRWSEPAGYFQGSFLTGVRYFDLNERSRFTAEGLNNNGAANNGPRFFDYNVGTRNDMVGWQIGSDLWYNFLPGIKFGAELKWGIYNNRSKQSTAIFANSLPSFGIPEINEHIEDNRTAFVTQFSPQMVYRLNYSWAIRASYQVLWIDNVALASNNFNGTPPSLFLPGSNRVPFLDNSSNVVYQGTTFGAEFTW